ncbi:hypothetical protein P4O66_021183, partial [Electrophorus voltai]
MAKERQRHFARAHANGQLPRQMNPVYLQPAVMCVDSYGPAPFPCGIAVAPSHVVGHVSGAVEAPPIKIFQHPTGLVEVHSHQPSPHVLTANPSIRASHWHSTPMPFCMRNAGLHTSESPQLPGNIGAYYTNQELYWQQVYWECSESEAHADEGQPPSKRPRENLFGEELLLCDSVVTKEGEAFFSDQILGLLEGIPGILDLAAEMGFS